MKSIILQGQQSPDWEGLEVMHPCPLDVSNCSPSPAGGTGGGSASRGGAVCVDYLVDGLEEGPAVFLAKGEGKLKFDSCARRSHS